MYKNIRIGDVLIEEGLITERQLKIVLEQQKNSTEGKRLGDILIESDYVSELQFIQCLSKRLKIPFINLNNYPITTDIAQMIQESTARKYHLVPIARKDQLLTVAMSDPMNLMAIEEIKFITKCKINPVIATRQEIESIIKRCYSGQEAVEAAQEVEKQYANREALNVMPRVKLIDIENAPVVKMINSIIYQGVSLGASDIHIEAEADGTRVRMRIDGQLNEQMKIRKGSHEAIVTRMKIMADMNITEKRVPQDGSFEMVVGDRKVDIRVSSIPTINGEKIVIRLLITQENEMMSKYEIGFTEYNLKLYEKMLKVPHGIILVTGPTGSGKTTTLYTILNELNKPTKNIITLEDPVEKKIKGVNQVHINNKAGLTFAGGLRAILRQDPDVVMLGEIRDAETASIAIRAAITGHLVFSTLHTNDVISTVTRLVDMGIEPYLVSAAVAGVISQRLTRCICPNCKVSYEVSEEEKGLLGESEVETLYKGIGCQQCNFTGYKGRRAVHEILVLDQNIRHLINKGYLQERIKEYCLENGMQTLRDNMKELVLKGETTTEELIRITYSLEE